MQVSSNTPSIRHPEQTLLPNVRFTGSLFKPLSGRKLGSKKESSDSSFLSFRKWSFFYKIFSSFVSPFFGRNFPAFVYVAWSMRRFLGPVYKNSRGQCAEGAETSRAMWTVSFLFSDTLYAKIVFPNWWLFSFAPPCALDNSWCRITEPFLLISTVRWLILEEVLFFDWRNFSVVTDTFSSVFCGLEAYCWTSFYPG